jgi:hypothetical protein
MMNPMKPHAEMIEGQEAWDRFRIAVKAVLKVPKSAVLAHERKQKVAKKKTAMKRARPEG